MSDPADFVLSPPPPPPLPTFAPPGEFGPAEPVSGALPEIRALLVRLRAAAREVTPVEASVQVLEIVARETVAELGRYDRQSLATWRELAHHRDGAGDSVGAIHLLQQLVPDMAQALGATDPETLHARLILATAIGNAGDPATAELQLRELLPALAATVGPQDARLLEAYYRISVQRGRAGDLAGSVQQLVHLVPQIQQTLGEQHPLLDAVRLDLARTVQRLGQQPGAPAGLGRVEAVAVVHRLMVWDFDSDREALACVEYLERRTGQKGLADRIFGAPEEMTADQLTGLILGHPGPGGGPAGMAPPPPNPWLPPRG